MIRTALSSILVLVTSFWSVMSSAAPAASRTNRETAAENAASLPSPKTRSDFFSLIHVINQAEVKLGNLALQRAGAEKTREFARMLVSDHTQGDSNMAAIVQRNNASLQTVHSEVKAKELDAQYNRLAKLSAADFDQEFATAMITGHRDAIITVEKALASETDAEVKQFYRDLIPQLQTHLHTAENLGVPTTG